MDCKHQYVAPVSHNSARLFLFVIFAAVDQTMLHSLCLSTVALAIGVLPKQYQPMFQYTVIQFQPRHHNFVSSLTFEVRFYRTVFTPLCNMLLHSGLPYSISTFPCCWWRSLQSYQPLHFPVLLPVVFLHLWCRVLIAVVLAEISHWEMIGNQIYHFQFFSILFYQCLSYCP